MPSAAEHLTLPVSHLEFPTCGARLEYSLNFRGRESRIRRGRVQRGDASELNVAQVVASAGAFPAALSLV